MDCKLDINQGGQLPGTKSMFCKAKSIRKVDKYCKDLRSRLEALKEKGDRLGKKYYKEKGQGHR